MDLFSEHDNGKNFTVDTERFWAEYASIRVMPKYIKPELSIENNDNGQSELIAIASNIDGLLQSRLSHGGQEIFLSRQIETDNFDLIVKSISYLNTEEITRMYISKMKQVVLLVLKDRHTIIIGNGKISDGSLPIFDLDDGFIANAFGMGACITELNDYFSKWRSTFDETNGANWDEPIIC